MSECSLTSQFAVTVEHPGTGSPRCQRAKESLVQNGGRCAQAHDGALSGSGQRSLWSASGPPLQRTPWHQPQDSMVARHQVRQRRARRCSDHNGVSLRTRMVAAPTPALPAAARDWRLTDVGPNPVSPLVNPVVTGAPSVPPQRRSSKPRTGSGGRSGIRWLVGNLCDTWGW